MIAAAFFALTFITFGESLRNDFTPLDDKMLIENPALQQFDLASLRTIFTSYDPELYIPLTFLSYYADHMLLGGTAAAYHLQNLLWHTLNALLVVVCIRLLTGRPRWALLCGVLFAIHPLQTEAVAWVSARKDVLFTFFFLTAVIAYIKFRQSGRPAFYAASLAACLLSLFAKVSAFTMPIILLLVQGQVPRVDGRKMRIVEVVPFFALSIVFGIVAVIGRRGSHGGELLSDTLIGFKSAAFYLWKLAWPSKLSLLYPQGELSSAFAWQLAASLGVLAAVSIAVWRLRKRAPFALFGWLFFLITLLPAFLPVRKGEFYADVYFASDRYAYVPSIGIFLLLLAVASVLLEQRSAAVRRIATGVAIAACAVFALLANRQILVWRNGETIYRNVLTQYPHVHLPYLGLGSVYYGQGRTDEALEYFQRSIAIKPTSEAYYNIGVLYGERGQTRMAIEAYEQAIAIMPANMLAQLNLGALLLRMEETEKAIAIFERLRSDVPELTAALYNLGSAYEQAGRRGDAAEAFRQFLEREPGNQAAQRKLEELVQGE